MRDACLLVVQHGDRALLGDGQVGQADRLVG
jgi:hypothetical protein